jgi:hypothetical protein
MNIVTPLPTAIPFTTSNVNTESVRRDNAQREVIPQLNQAENSAAESGLGSESDRLRQSAKSSQPAQSPVYERPTVQQNPNASVDASVLQNSNGETPDNAQQESAGREDAEERQRQQQEAAEQRQVDELKARDREVRAHEQAHAAVGGQYAGSPSYEFETGPDGQQYAVGGEVSIDISKETDPSDTIDKMQKVRAAALAPAEPSPQDFRVASEANRLAVEARAELAQQQFEEQQDNQEENFDRVFDDASPQAKGTSQATGSAQDAIDDQIPELDDIVQPGDVGTPTRSLDQAQLRENRETASLFNGGILNAGSADQNTVSLQTESLETPSEASVLPGQRDDEINQRALRIASFYQQTSTPRGVAAFQQTV